MCRGTARSKGTSSFASPIWHISSNMAEERTAAGRIRLCADTGTVRCLPAGGHLCIVTDRESLYARLQAAQEPILFHEGNIVKKRGPAQMGGENGALSTGRTIVDSTLNITNRAAAAYVSACGSSTMVLSLEHDRQSLQALCDAFRKKTVICRIWPSSCTATAI